MYSWTIPSERESQRVLTAGYVGCVEKAKTVCQYVKFSLYNSLRIINYLIPPWRKSRERVCEEGGFWKSATYRTYGTWVIILHIPVVHFGSKIKKVVHLIKKSYVWLNSKQLNIINNLEQSYKKILEVLSIFSGKKLLKED